jgi:hypothetical protein
MKRPETGVAACRITTFVTIIMISAAFSLLVPAETVSGQEYAFVVTTDYHSAAYYSTIEVQPPRTARVSIGAVSTDPVAYYDFNEDMVFVVNRYLGDNIQIVDPNQDFATVGQYSVGNGSNPHDIRLAGGEKAYVSRYEWKTLLIVHPYTGDSLGVIDLSPVADPDGIPEMDRMEIVDDRLFVTLSSIDHVTWLPDGPGKIAVIDIAADTLVDCDSAVPGIQPIVLELPNPYGELRYDFLSGDLIVSCLGSWGVFDGGVETVDPVILESNGIAISEADLGGDVSDALFAPDGRGYAVVLDAVPWPDNHARLVAFDRATPEVTDTLCRQTSGMGSSLATIELNRQEELYLCDRDVTQPGIRIFETHTDTLITFIDVGLPPFDVAFVQPSVTDTVGATPDGQPLSASNYPNPFCMSTQVRYTVPSGGQSSSVRLSIYDPLGRLVDKLVDTTMPAGTYTAGWDGRDRQGRRVAGGLYFCRFCADGRARSIPLVLTR